MRKHIHFTTILVWRDICHFCLLSVGQNSGTRPHWAQRVRTRGGWVEQSDQLCLWEQKEPGFGGLSQPLLSLQSHGFLFFPLGLHIQFSLSLDQESRDVTLCTSSPFLVYFVGKLKSVCLLGVGESSVLVFSCYDNLVFVRISASLNKLGLQNEIYCIFSCVYMCKCMCIRRSMEARRGHMIIWSWC